MRLTNNETVNKCSLAAAGVVGIAGIILSKLDGWSPIFVIGWPVGILLVYCIAMRSLSDRAIYEIIGDNCYYLGFIFTLVSLAVTLYLLHLDDASDELPIQNVISGFGIALSSTIFGIALRVLMLRMTPDIAQRESEARLDLDLAVRDFRAHLRMSVDELKRHSVETAQVLAEQRNAALNTVTEGAEEHRLALQSSTAALSTLSETMDKQFSEYRVILRKALDGIAETISERDQATQRDFREHLSVSIDELKSHSVETAQVLAEQRNTALNAVTEGAEEYRLALQSSTAALSTLSETMDKQFSEYRAVLRKALDGIAETLSERHRTIQDTLQRSTDDHREVLESSAENLGRLGDQAAQAISDHQKELQRLATVSRETHEPVRAVSETLRKELEEAKALVASVGNLNQENRNLGTVFSGLIGQLEKIDGGIAQKLDPAVAQVSESAAAIAATLAESSGKLQTAAAQFESAADRTTAADAQTGIASAVEQLEAANRTLAETITKLDDLASKQANAFSGRRWFGGRGRGNR
ncbi:MAG: hypothetical protein OXC93_01820 [Rhodospirillaceae bacterium]|nr:hypothetical protein [Rhodospirillaceae bacterium]